MRDWQHLTWPSLTTIVRVPSGKKSNEVTVNSDLYVNCLTVKINQLISEIKNGVAP